MQPEDSDPRRIRPTRSLGRHGGFKGQRHPSAQWQTKIAAQAESHSHGRICFSRMGDTGARDEPD